MPPSIQRSNAKHYKGKTTVTEVKEYPGRAHLMTAQEGWEQIADDVLDWAMEHAVRRRDGAPRHPHRRARRSWSRSRGWRLLVDPTFDPPGRRYHFGWGTASTQGRGARPSPPATCPRSTPCCSPTTTTPTTSTTRVGPCCPAPARCSRPSPAPAGWAVARSASSPGRPRGSRRRDRPTIDVTATPCRHGPPASTPDRRRTSSGSRCGGRGRRTASCGSRATPSSIAGVREVADRLDIGTALLHLGGVRFPVTGPIRYTMTAEDGVELCGSCARRRRSRSTTRAGRTSSRTATAMDAVFAAAPPEVRAALRWLPIGAATEVVVYGRRSEARVASVGRGVARARRGCGRGRAVGERHHALGELLRQRRLRVLHRRLVRVEEPRTSCRGRVRRGHDRRSTGALVAIVAAYGRLHSASTSCISSKRDEFRATR